MTRIELQLEGELESRVVQKANELQMSLPEYIQKVLQESQISSARDCIGMFSDIPEVMDEIIRDVYASRANTPMRTPDNA